jgi:hypothetical protein
MPDSMEPAVPPRGWVPPDEREISVRRRLAYFATAWAIALGLTWVFTIPDPVMIIAAPFFPGGLFFFLPREAAVIAGWASYLTLSFFLLSARTWGRYKVLLVVLCVLLAVNVPGCGHVVNNTRLPHTI